MRFLFFSALLLMQSGAVWAQGSAPGSAERPRPTRTDSLTSEIERLYGSLRFDDLRDQVAVRLNASAQQSQLTPRTHNFQARLITQFFVVQAAQEWLNEKEHHIEVEVEDKVDAEAQRIATAVKDEFDDTTTSGKQTDENLRKVAKGKSQSFLGHPDLAKNLWNLSFDTRANYNYGLDVYAHLRLRRDIKTENWVNSLTYDGGWSTDEQWVSTIGTQSSHAMSESLLLTWGNAFSRKFTEDFTTTSHGPSVAWRITSSQALTWSATVNTKLGQQSGFVDAYSTGLAYRLELDKDRFFISANPSVNYKKDNQFRQDAGIYVSLEATL